jgi:hypothetical protein
VSEDIENPLVNYSRVSGDIGDPLSKSLEVHHLAHIYQRLPVPSDPLPEGKVVRDSEKMSFKVILILYYLGKVSVKQLYRFKTQKF